MAQIKVWDGANWMDAKAVYYWDGSTWRKKKLKYWNGSSWIDAIQYIYTKQYAPVAWQTYWNSGNKDNQYPDEHIQGTWDGTTSHIRRELIIFDYNAIAADLAGATIQSVKLKLMRMDTAHGVSSEGIAVIHSHNISSIPDTWTGTGLTQQATAGLLRGEEKWITLPIAVGEGFRDGTIKGLALSTTSTSITYYVRFDASRTLLEVTFEK